MRSFFFSKLIFASLYSTRQQLRNSHLHQRLWAYFPSDLRINVKNRFLSCEKGMQCRTQISLYTQIVILQRSAMWLSFFSEGCHDTSFYWTAIDDEKSHARCWDIAWGLQASKILLMLPAFNDIIAVALLPLYTYLPVLLQPEQPFKAHYLLL